MLKLLFFLLAILCCVLGFFNVGGRNWWYGVVGCAIVALYVV